MFDFIYDPSSFSDSSGRLQFWWRLLPYALLLSVTFALYVSTLYFGFVWDDVVYITQNYRIQGLSWPQIRAIWTHPYLGHYAPIHHMFLAILHHFTGMNPFGYHAGQLLVHAACVCLLYFVLKKIEAPHIALLATLLFAVHPVNVETVAWISETKSTLAFLFFLLSFLSFVHFRSSGRARYGLFSGFWLIVSMLAKINTVVAPAIFLLWDYKQEGAIRKKRIFSLALFFLLSALFVLIHLHSFYQSGEVLEGARYYGGLSVHLLNIPMFLLFYIQMLVFPYPLTAWHMFPITKVMNWSVGGAWIALLGLMWVCYRSSRDTQFWQLWFLVFLSPMLQIFPFGIWVAERYLYIPAIGVFVLASKGFFGLLKRAPRLWQRFGMETAAAAVLLVFSGVTLHHLPVWRDDLTLWRATTPTCETSAYCHCNLGLALLQNGQTEQGVKELIRSVNLRPASRYLIRLGDAYTLSLHDYKQALIAYNMAFQRRGAEINANFFAKLARLYILTGKLKLAQRAIAAGSKMNPDDPGLLVSDGFLQWKLGNLAAARSSLRKALIMTGQSSNVAGFLYIIWGNAADVGRLLSDLRPAAAHDGANDVRSVGKGKNKKREPEAPPLQKQSG